MTAKHTSSRTLKAPAFDGQTTWSIYKSLFEASAKSNHWKEQERATAFILALKGRAAEVLQTIPVSLHSDAASIMNALETRYGDAT